MSVAMSVELGTSTAVDFDDRIREIQDTAAAMPELGEPMAGAARAFRNPSIVSTHCQRHIASETGFTESGFRFVNLMHFFTES